MNRKKNDTMWSGKFDDRTTGRLRRGDFVWVTPSNPRHIAQTAMFLGHKEKTVEVQMEPNVVSTHLKPKNVMPWASHMDPWPWGDRPGRQKTSTASPDVPKQSNKKGGASVARTSGMSSDGSSSIRIPVGTHRARPKMGSNRAPSDFVSNFVDPQAPARAKLQSLISQERWKIEQSQEHIVNLIQALDLLDADTDED